MLHPFTFAERVALMAFVAIPAGWLLAMSPAADDRFTTHIGTVLTGAFIVGGVVGAWRFLRQSQHPSLLLRLSEICLGFGGLTWIARLLLLTFVVT